MWQTIKNTGTLEEKKINFAEAMMGLWESAFAIEHGDWQAVYYNFTKMFGENLAYKEMLKGEHLLIDNTFEGGRRFERNKIVRHLKELIRICVQHNDLYLKKEGHLNSEIRFEIKGIRTAVKHITEGKH